MKNEFKLYQVIASLNEKEIRQVRKILKSPFFIRRADVRLLFDALIKYHSAKRSIPGPEIIFQQIYPGLAWNYLKLRATMSELLSLIEECWMINHWRSHKINSNLIIAEIYRHRNLDKCYSSTMKKTDQLLDAQPKRNADYYKYLIEFQTEQMEYQSSTKRTEDLYLQEISDTNDILYLIQKLKTTCAQLSHQLVRKRTYDFGLLSGLLKEIDQERYIKVPAIAIYYYCFRFLTEAEGLQYFQKFKDLLLQFRHQFSIEDLKAPYRLAINFCIRKTNEGVSSFIQDSWELYKEGLAEGILLENNYIPRFTFNNAIAAALRLNELDWIESFIENSSRKLEETFRDQTISFNLARLEYARQNYEKALLHLQSSENKDVMNNMISKILLVKIYMDIGVFESLNSHLDSFEQFIRRNQVSDYHKTNILNIIRYSRKIISIPNYDKSEKAKIRQQIKTEPILSERNWLLEKI